MKKISFVFLLILAIILFFYWNIFIKSFEEFACWLYPFDESRNAELLKILLTVIGGMGILFGLYLNYKRTKSSDKAIQLQSLAISKQSDQLELSRKSQIDERFKNAVEHLGSDKEPIILGGVAVLHQIAIENPANYSEVVFNILTSFVRSSTNIYSKTADDFSQTIIQTIINNLFKPKENVENPYKSFKGNLSHCNLNSINIDNVDFDGFDLSFTLFGTRINNVNFSNAGLAKAQFIISRIKSSNFTNANLHQTLFNMAVIEDSNFEKASILATNFLTTRFLRINFNNCTFSNAKFICCFFNETSHFNSDIIDNDFSFASFKNVSFEDTNLFNKADFKGALFYNLKINPFSSNINFNGCNVLETSFIFDYCQLIEKLRVEVNKKSDTSGIVNLYKLKYFDGITFDSFGETDINDTKEKLDEIIKSFKIIQEKKK